MSNITVIGAGAWGSALAQAATVAGNDVCLIGRAQNVVDEINSTHTNAKYLPDVFLDKAIKASCDFGKLARAEIVVLAVPAQVTRTVLQGVQAKLKRAVPVIVTAKGFEHKSLALQFDIVNEEWPLASQIVLSGPSFAVDMGENKPIAVTLASKDAAALAEVATRFGSHVLRPYLSNDPQGVSLCGGLKNVYALGSGAIEGAGLGLSARSAFVARALAEMARIVAAFGGKNSSVFGLAGAGDLMLSCTSEQSRNYRFGIELGRGKNVAQILDMGLGLAEGVATAPVAMAMVAKAKIDAPLVGAVNDLLDQKLSVSQVVNYLMERDIKTEGA